MGLLRWWEIKCNESNRISDSQDELERETVACKSRENASLSRGGPYGCVIELESAVGPLGHGGRICEVGLLIASHPKGARGLLDV